MQLQILTRSGGNIYHHLLNNFPGPPSTDMIIVCYWFKEVNFWGKNIKQNINRPSQPAEAFIFFIIKIDTHMLLLSPHYLICLTPETVCQTSSKSFITHSMCYEWFWTCLTDCFSSHHLQHVSDCKTDKTLAHQKCICTNISFRSVINDINKIEISQSSHN